MAERLTKTRLEEIRARFVAALSDYSDQDPRVQPQVRLFGEDIAALLDEVAALRAEIRGLMEILHDSFMALPLTSRKALGWDGNNLVPHVEAVAAEYGPLRPLVEELARARAKHPDQHRMLAALMEEVGETAQAYLEGHPRYAREEALQVACVAMRIYQDGDWDYEMSLGGEGND